MNTYVMGDIHGCYRGLIQCLQRCKFDKENDTLIQLGDVADGWSEVYECVEELLTIKNLIAIKGNHDDWFLKYLKTGQPPTNWTQGAEATARSYLRQIDKEHLIQKVANGYLIAINPDDVPPAHQLFFEQQHLYYVDDGEGDIEKYRCFVHGGFNRHLDFKGQRPTEIYYWDRDLWMSALSFHSINSRFKMFNPFAEVYIGHTATTSWGTDKPMQAANIWNLDTGAGFNGRLTIMNIDTHEYWQSDPVKLLYPDETGRR